MALNSESRAEAQPLLHPNRELIEAGGAVHLLHPRSKRPVESEWSTAPVYTLEDLEAKYKPGRNIGLRLGEPSRTAAGYIHALDLDIRDPAKKGEAWSTLLDLCPEADSLPTVKSGSGGDSLHLYFFSDTPLPSKLLAKGEGWQIELLGTGKQVVLPPSIHPDTGRRYEWKRGPDWLLVDLGIGPTIDTGRLIPARDEEAFIDLLADPVPLADMRRALSFITDADDRDIWLKIGMALHHETGGSDEGYQLWGTWSEQSFKFDSKVQRQTWKGFGKSRAAPVTAASIFDIAKKYGWTGAPEILKDDFEDMLPREDAKPKPSRLQFLSPDDCDAAPSRGYVVKGMLAPGDVGAIVGQPGAGKSLIAPFLGYKVARGEAAFGMRTKPGRVFYVAAEDPHGMKGRVRALRAAHGGADEFRLVEGVSNLLDRDSPDLAALRAAVKEQRPSLVIIDTLALAFPDLEENDAASMGRVVTVARKLASYGAAVLLVHHDTKSGDGLPRGHSILNGALDVAVHVKRDEGGIIRGNLSKNRNGTCDRDIAFVVATEDGGVDEDGDAITLPRCEPLADDFGDLKLTRQQRAVLRIMQNIAGEGETEIEESVLREACVEKYAMSDADKEDSRSKAYRRARSELAGHGVIRCHVRPSDGVDVVTLLNPKTFEVDAIDPGHGRTCPDIAESPARQRPDGHGQGL